MARTQLQCKYSRDEQMDTRRDNAICQTLGTHGLNSEKEKRKNESDHTLAFQCSGEVDQD
jgi:hypothetical protein